MRLGIDAGNNKVKVVNRYGAYSFISCLGEWRELKDQAKNNSDKDDMSFEYEGKKGFAGTLAKRESEYMREMMGDSKAHDDAKLRVLLALHRFSNDTINDIIVGQPIEKHTDAEKHKIKDMLKGRHVLTINGEEKTIIIRNVEIAAEGAGAYFATKIYEPKVRIIDVGSGTVNCATIEEDFFIDKDSYTMKFGANSTKANDFEGMANAIIARSSQKWDKHDVVYVAGGIAEAISPYLGKYYENTKVLKPQIKTGKSIRTIHPVYANAMGFYELSRVIFND